MTTIAQAEAAFAESTLKQACSFYKKNRGSFSKVLPVASASGLTIGKQQIKQVRKHIDSWKAKRLDSRAAISLICAPLMEVREALIAADLLAE